MKQTNYNIMSNSTYDYKVFNDRIYFGDGTISDTIPSSRKSYSSAVINGHFYINGYEYKNGKWKKTLKAFFYCYLY